MRCSTISTATPKHPTPAHSRRCPFCPSWAWSGGFSTFHYDWRWALPASPEALWPFVSNTNHFNRAAGVPHVDRLGSAGPNGRQRLRLKRFGVVVEWDEYPFEWERPRRFSVRRVYARGPVAEMRVQVDLEPSATGCE